MTHEDYKELLAAKALSALDAADARALHIHLEGCTDCQFEMVELADAAALLASQAEPLEPSTKVRELILASVRDEVRAGFRSDRVSPDVSQLDGNVLAFERPSRNVWSSLGSFGTLAATFVFVALIIALGVLWQKNRTTQSELARLKAEMKEAQAQVNRNHAMAELLTSPDAHMAKLTGTKVAPGAQAMLAYDKNGHAMLMAKGLPSAPEGMAYQLWYIKDNKKMPGKVFSLDAAGNGMLEDQIPAVARDAAVFAITLEPKGGVQVPTGSIYLLSSS
ncbi:MAG TPA: anti-sigma factor [Pyrinomonadaceae bacterium]|nr:anti-sigma factor [Pyrinomonadaceae bacterium]